MDDIEIEGRLLAHRVMLQALLNAQPELVSLVMCECVAALPNAIEGLGKGHEGAKLMTAVDEEIRHLWGR